jgi:hypothetical protein
VDRQRGGFGLCGTRLSGRFLRKYFTPLFGLALAMTTPRPHGQDDQGGNHENSYCSDDNNPHIAGGSVCRSSCIAALVTRLTAPTHI